MLCVLFAGLAVDALRTHGSKTRSFEAREADPRSLDPSLWPIAKRSGRSVALIFAALAVVSGAGALFVAPAA
jgi:hypothetical protein